MHDDSFDDGYQPQDEPSVGLRCRVKRLRVPEGPAVTPPGGGGGFRTGADLVADADTQALAAAPSAVTHRAFYEQKLDAGRLQDKREVAVGVSDTGDFEGMTDAAQAFNPGVDYYTGWSEGSHLVLLRRDLATGRRIKELHPFEWYFYVSRADYERLPREKWDWLCRHHAQRVEPDPRFPDRYVRVYVEQVVPKFDPQRCFDNVGDPEWGARWAEPIWLGERPHAFRFPTDRDRWTDLHEVVNWCLRKGVEPLEADLTPKQRFLTDHDIGIQARYRTAFFDLETDDSVGGFDNKEQARILSVAWEGDHVEDDPDDRGFLVLREETDEAERELLLEFKRRVIEPYDVLAAWNGVGFDFPVLIYRMHRLGIRINWWRHLLVDPLPIFKRHYIRAGSDATSFSLDAIGDKVLGLRKLDWRTRFRERQPGVTPTFLNLYRYDKDLLEEYNRYDATILRKLEQFTGFCEIERIFCRVANGFATDFQISTKIDQLLLKKGFREGHHFRTRFWSGKEVEQYEGAYVFPPVVGMHRNVVAFDFKSLYPSMVRAFNVSPETLVKEADRDQFAADQLCTCPVVEIEKVDAEGRTTTVRKGGSTFRIDREGFISQMFVRTLERRKKYTDLQAKRLDQVGTTQDDLYLLYYRLAYSFKRLGLSFYGDMGNARSRYYDTELAEAITLSGRFFIKATEQLAAECGYRVLYGDTDSCYVQLAPTDKVWPSEDARIAEIVEAGERFTAYCQRRYDEILREQGCNLAWNTILLEFEDVYDRIFFVCKKRYAGRMLWHKGSRTDHVEVKGLEVMRSDVSGMTRKLQQRVLDAILVHGCDAERVEREVIAPEFNRCVNGELTVDEVSIGKGLSKEPDRYKTQSLHVKLAEKLRASGQGFFVGMKIEHIVTGTKPTLQGMLREEYEADPSATYAADFYWDRCVFPASLRILKVCYPERNWESWLVTNRARRQKLVERYKQWLLDPKRVQKAITQIKENSRGLLTPEDLAELRNAPRVRALR